MGFSIIGPITIFVDNQAAIDLSSNPIKTGRNLHMNARYFYIRDMVESQEIVVPLVNTQENDADFFTKPLAPKRYKYLRRRIMNIRPEEAK